jgi:hypothetical protein
MNDTQNRAQRPARITEGTVVRTLRHGDVGTVQQRKGRWLFVAWHGTCVESQLDVAEVELVPDPTAEQAGWRGAIAILTPDGYHVEPVAPVAQDAPLEGGER